MSGFDYYNRAGERITFDQYLEHMSDRDSAEAFRRVGDDTVDEIRVSTVLLAMDHNWSRVGPPILFETMLFGTTDEDNPMVRYSTEEQARKGHEQIVEELRAGRRPNLAKFGEQG